jgi:hypothetical protein
MVDRRSRNDGAQWSCVQNKEKRTKNRTLRNAKQKLKRRRFDATNVNRERPG